LPQSIYLAADLNWDGLSNWRLFWIHRKFSPLCSAAFRTPSTQRVNHCARSSWPKRLHLGVAAHQRNPQMHEEVGAFAPGALLHYIGQLFEIGARLI
jgi:hypothetical protein